MSTLAVDNLVARPAPSGDLSQKRNVARVFEAAGDFVLKRPRLACLIVLPLALLIGSLVGVSLGGIGQEKPPPLIRLAP